MVLYTWAGKKFLNNPNLCPPFSLKFLKLSEAKLYYDDNALFALRLVIVKNNDSMRIKSSKVRERLLKPGEESISQEMEGEFPIMAPPPFDLFKDGVNLQGGASPLGQNPLNLSDFDSKHETDAEADADPMSHVGPLPMEHRPPITASPVAPAPGFSEMELFGEEEGEMQLSGELETGIPGMEQPDSNGESNDNNNPNGEGGGATPSDTPPSVNAEGNNPPAEQPGNNPPAAEGGDAGGEGQGLEGGANPQEGGAMEGGLGEGGAGGDGGAMDMPAFEQEAPALDTSSLGGVVQSLTSQEPTAIVAAMGEIGTNLTEARGQENEKAKEGLPEIEQPTGLGTDGVKEVGKVESEVETGDTPDVDTQTSGEKQEVDTTAPEPKGPNPADQVVTPPAESLANPSNFMGAVNTIPEVDGSIDTNMGPRPKVELKGDLDPARSDEAQDKALESVDEQMLSSNTESNKDFKEGEVMPSLEKEQMKVETEFGTGEGFASSVEGLPQMDAETAAALNAGILNEYNDELSDQVSQQESAEQDYLTNSDTEREKALSDIDAENEKIKQQQIDAKAEGKAEVDAHRQEWQAENAKVSSEFKSKSAKKRGEIEGQIQQKVNETNTKVEQEFSKAESEAQSKVTTARNDIKQKKDEARAKEEDKSWWEKAIDAVANFFEQIKKAVTAIFDALRAAVKFIIQKAKELASKLIDMARDAIKGLIDAFAAALKEFVKLALAAFPELAERFCNLIDAVVEKLKETVDQLAEVLKAAVELLLDALGSAIDALLSAYEALINGILSVIEGLVVIWIKIMRGIANLVMAAGQSPGAFMGQISEELLGQDVTQPLQNEYPQSQIEEGISQDVEQEVQNIGDSEIEGLMPDDEAAIEELLSKQSYQAEDFDVPVLADAQLDPELLAQISGMGEGEYDIASFDDSEHGMDALKAEFGVDPNQAGEMNAATGEVQEAASTVAATPVGTDRDRFKPDANGMVGPFTTGERAKFVTSQMLDGIKKWWSENKVTIIAALIGIIGGAILANILTGGAIMAALPLVMQLVGAYFAAEAIAKATGYFGSYLGKSFPGDIAGGAKALARALAIGAIELVFALVFGAKGALKAAKGAAKTVAKQGVKGAVKTGAKTAANAAKASVKTTAKNAVQLAKVAKNGAKTAGKNIIKGGKFAMNGLKKGALAGAKTLDDLGQRLGKFFKFKGFKLRVRNKRWNLFGIINPEVLVATGEVVQKPRGSGGMGKHVDDIDGFVISQADNATTQFLKGNPAAAADLHHILKNGNVRPKEIIKAMDGMGPDEMADFINHLKQFKNTDEAALARAVENYRTNTGISKTRKADGSGFDGGTVAAGKADLNIDMPSKKEPYMGASSNAQSGAPSHNPRYESPQPSPKAKNHAEQTVLGGIADDIHASIAKSGMNPSDVKGNISISVDQAVCSACRQGFSGDVAAGIIKQFAEEFPNIRIIISNTEKGMKGTELLIIQGGKVLGK